MPRVSLKEQAASHARMVKACDVWHLQWRRRGGMEVTGKRTPMEKEIFAEVCGLALARLGVLVRGQVEAL